MTLLCLSCLTAISAAACTVAPPTPPTFGKQTTSQATDGGTQLQQLAQANQNPDMVDPSFVAPPALDPVPQTSAYATVPVHGAAQPSSTVLIVSSTGQTVSADVDVTGRFCADLPLVANTQNSFQVADVNLNGVESTPVALTVTQQGQPEQQPAPAQSENAALAGTAGSSGLEVIADASSINDGDPSTSLEGYLNSRFSGAAMVIALASKQRINRIVAMAPTDCPFTNPVKLYLTAADAPSAPTDGVAAGWSEMPLDASTGTSSVSASFTSAIATNIAIVFPASGWTGPFNCGGAFDGAGYGVTELQAWTVANVTPPAPSAPTCAGGM